MTKDEILKWLKRYDSEYSSNQYTINDDMSIDVKGSVNINTKNLTHIPIKFNIVNGDFYCIYNKLTSLENCPNIVNGDFNCSYNKLTSLEHCPHTVDSNFWCENNKLKSLKGIGYIGDKLYCDDKNLKDDVYYKSYLLLKQLQK